MIVTVIHEVTPQTSFRCYKVKMGVLHLCNGKEMWPVVESRTVIIPPLYKPPVSRPPKKRKKSIDELAS